MSNVNLFASLGSAKNAAIAVINEFNKVINWPNCWLVIGTVCGLLQQSGVKTIGLQWLWPEQLLFICFLLI